MEERDEVAPAPEPDEAPEGGNDAPTKEAGRAGISTGRKLRLAGLVCLLLAVIAVWVVVRVRERRAEEARVREVADTVAELRAMLPRLRLDMPRQELAQEMSHAYDLMRRLDEIDPGNQEAAALTVPFVFRAGDLPQAVINYNNLGSTGAETDYRRGMQALTDFQLLIIDAAGSEIRQEGLRYLSTCSFLWTLARRITRGLETDHDKALAVCSWMAGHLGPADADAVLADPAINCSRGYGSPAELAWTYSELLRQLEVPCRALVPAGEAEQPVAGYVVRVEPREGEPLLVDTSRCVPLLDPASGAPIRLESLRDDAELRQQVALQMGDQPGALDYVPDARLKLAVHPYTCYKRFMAFDKLLSALPERPRFVLDFAAIPSDEVPELWRAPVEIAEQMAGERYPNLSRQDLAALDMMPQRDDQLRGRPDAALPAYEQLMMRLRDELSRADAEQGIKTLHRAIEMAAFFEGSAALEAGDARGAAARLKSFVAEHKDGRFGAPAAVLLADALEQAGDADAAKAAWQSVLPPRARYAQLRLQGALPPSVRPAAEAQQKE